MKDKMLRIRVDSDFLSKLEYLRKINGWRTIAETVRKIVEKEYRKNKNRAEKRLITTCEDMVKVGIITRFETEEEIKRGKKALSKVKFYLNPNYPRKLKEETQDGQQTES